MKQPTVPQDRWPLLKSSLLLYRKGLKKILPLCAFYFFTLFMLNYLYPWYSAYPMAKIVIPYLKILILTPFIFSAFIDGLNTFLSGKPVNYRVCLINAGRHFPHVFLGSLVFTTAISICVLLFMQVSAWLAIIPTMVIMSFFIFFYMFILVENKNFVTALKASLELVKNEWLHTMTLLIITIAALLLLTYAATFLISSLGFLIALVNPQIAQNTVNVLLILTPALLSPLIACVLLMLYRDLKLRKNLQQLEYSVSV